jgi:predicted RNA-binding protein with RPS1 domain
MIGAMEDPDPLRAFAAAHQRGERLTGPITRVADDIGLFVQVDVGLWGIVHLKDIDRQDSGEHAIKRYAVGQVIEATILSIDVEQQRVSLGIKQLDGSDPGDAPLPVKPGPPWPNPPRRFAARRELPVCDENASDSVTSPGPRS